MIALEKIVLASAFLAVVGNVCLAAPPASQGADMWAGAMDKETLFQPHDNSCNASEAFVTVEPSGKGFCIEKTTRTAAYWEEARNTCVSALKRLPEPGEWRFACTRAGSLGLTITGAWEWGSNFTSQAVQTTSNFGTFVPIFGYTNCSSGALGEVATWTGSVASTFQYRCVR